MQDGGRRASNCTGVDKISRRGFAKILGVGAVGWFARPAISAKEPQRPPITEKFDERTKAIYDQTVQANSAQARSRLRFELPENSEPCTVFKAEAPK